MRHLSPRSVRVGPLALVAGLALLASSAAISGGESWQSLPATPALPQPVTSGLAPVNDIRMFHAVFGKGPPLLLLHGGLANSNYWGAVIPIFVAHHYRVIVADSRGHGRSSRSSQPYSYDLMAADVLALLDYLKIRRADLVGWSDGAIIGLDIAMHQRESLWHASEPAGVWPRRPLFLQKP